MESEVTVCVGVEPNTVSKSEHNENKALCQSQDENFETSQSSTAVAESMQNDDPLLEHSFISQDADSTLLGSQLCTDGDGGEIRTKIQDFSLDIVDICKVEENRRSSTVNKLGHEVFKMNVYKDKQSGFVTTRPLEWFKALQNYVKTYKINDRSQISTRLVNKVNKFSICKVRLAFGTKDLNFQINFNTGVFNVKGPAYAEWIESEFVKLKQFMSPLVPCTEPSSLNVVHTPMEPPTLDTCVDPPTKTTESEAELKRLWAFVNELKTQGSNRESEIKEFWNNVNDMKNAFRSVEESIAGFSARIETNSTSMLDRFNQLDVKMKNLEKRVEDKIRVYQDVNDESVEKRCSKLTTDLNDKIV